MLLERNENRKEPTVPSFGQGNSQKKVTKSLKENFIGQNNKEFLLKSSKVSINDLNAQVNDLILIETRKISSDYLKKILTNELQKIPENFRSDFLSRHGFGWEIRARMVF